MDSTSQRQQTKLIIDGLLHRCNIAGVPYYIVNRGGNDGCAILCKCYVAAKGAKLYGQMRDMDGELKWYEVFDGNTEVESKVDAHMKSEISMDPDLWAIEFELAEFLNPFDADDFLIMES
jgi:hypothetical protein